MDASRIAWGALVLVSLAGAAGCCDTTSHRSAEILSHTDAAIASEVEAQSALQAWHDSVVAVPSSYPFDTSTWTIGTTQHSVTGGDVLGLEGTTYWMAPVTCDPPEAACPDSLGIDASGRVFIVSVSISNC